MKTFAFIFIKVHLPFYGPVCEMINWSFWSVAVSALVSICMNTLASSANIFNKLVITSCMSFMNTTKRVGPRTEPCGIPLIIIIIFI